MARSGLLRGLNPAAIIDGSSESGGPRRGRRATTVSAANLDEKFHPMDQFLRPNAPAARKHVRPGSDEEEGGARDADSEPPERRRSGRQRRQGRPLYDATRHPVDDMLSSQSASEPDPATVLQSIEGEGEAGNEAAEDVNLLTQSFWPHWRLLSPLDQRLVALQQGLPDASSVLPYTWSKVASILVGDRHFTYSKYRAWGGEAMLRKRYERLRQHLQKDATSEPHRKEDWGVKWREGWDVFDTKPGETYEMSKRHLPEIKGVSAHGELLLGNTETDNDETLRVEDHGTPLSQTAVDLTAVPDSATSSDYESTRSAQSPVPAPIALMGRARGLPQVLDSGDEPALTSSGIHRAQLQRRLVKHGRSSPSDGGARSKAAAAARRPQSHGGKIYEDLKEPARTDTPYYVPPDSQGDKENQEEPPASPTRQSVGAELMRQAEEDGIIG